MKLRNMIIPVLVVLAIGACQAVKFDGRIIDGELDKIENFPHLVQLHFKNRHICGGSLIEPDKVLTAAHCLFDMDINDFTIIGGSSFTKRGGVKRKIIKKILPSDYNNSTGYADYAVVKLNATLVGDNIKTIGLCTKSATAGTKALVAGWGRIDLLRASNQVRSVEIPLIPKDVCVRKYSGVDRKFDPTTMLCAAGPGRKDACRGDSGGALVINGEVHGIVSWAVSCGLVNYPGIYVDVCVMRESIAKLLKDL